MEKFSKIKAFLSGFENGFVSAIYFSETKSLKETSCQRISSIDKSYLEEDGDIKRIGNDMYKAIDHIANAP